MPSRGCKNNVCYIERDENEDESIDEFDKYILNHNSRRNRLQL